MTKFIYFFIFSLVLVFNHDYFHVQGGPKKLATITNHNKIVLNPAIKARFFINFDYKMSARI